jgi:hypothetical protein
VIFWFIQFSLNRYRSSPILIENISYFLEWTFSIRFYNSIEFSSVLGCQQRWLTRSLLLFITVPRCFTPPYIVGSGCPVSRDISGCPVSRDIAGPFSPPFFFFSIQQNWRLLAVIIDLKIYIHFCILHLSQWIIYKLFVFFLQIFGKTMYIEIIGLQ